MLPASVLQHLAPADAARLERAAAIPETKTARELAEVLQNGARCGASPEQLALALGIVLSLAERQPVLEAE